MGNGQLNESKGWYV